MKSFSRILGSCEGKCYHLYGQAISTGCINYCGYSVINGGTCGGNTCIGNCGGSACGDNCVGQCVVVMSSGCSG